MSAHGAATASPGADLTGEQRAIVGDRNADMLVSAGAGSGKTRVLVERYVALLATCRIPEIVAVTFTDAAAAEMRDRVRREVHRRPSLAGHRAEIDQAVIGTIHSLCLRLLREHPVAAGPIALARILPDDEAEYERIGAAMDALEAGAQAGDGRAEAVSEISVYWLTEQLPRMIDQRDQVREAFGSLAGARDGGGSRRHQDDRAARAARLAAWTAYVKGALDGAQRKAVAAALPELERLVAALREAWAGAAPDDKLAQQVGVVLATLGEREGQDAAALIDTIVSAAGAINLRPGKKASWQDMAQVKDDLRALRDLAKSLQNAPRWGPDDGLALRTTAALHDLFMDACRRYRLRKSALGACDYLDLEIEAVRLLRQHPEIAAACRARYRHVMVDEFQDVNDTQIALVRLLTDPDGSGTARPHRFLVGDAKQSIYRFRGSNVAHFTQFEAELRRSGGALHALTQSFRTHDELVSVSNALFRPLFASGGNGSGVRMQRMSGRGPAGREGPHLTVITLEKQGRNSAAGALECRRVEADAVAAEIAGLLRGGAAVCDPETRRERPATARDVAVLLRRLAYVHVFEQALESHGVPYVTPAGAGFFTRQEIRDLTNLLAWLAEPDDLIALVGALRSPLFMIDDRTLLACHAAEHNWMRVLQRPPASVADDERRRCAHAAEVLADLRRTVAIDPVDAIVERALVLTGFEASWAPLRGGEQALANIRKLVAILRSLGGRSIDEAVGYLRRRRDELVDREGLAVIDQTDAVRVLTVHGAKGLEFPIVFVPEAHARPPRSTEPVRWRAADGISMTLSPGAGATASDPRRQPGMHRYLQQRDQHDEDAEHRRLLYVAATRAADRLYLSGDGQAGDGSWLGLCNDTLAGLDPALVNLRPALPVDVAAIARRAVPTDVPVPPAADEEPVAAPLVERPAVIPLRASTPVTGLRPPPRYVAASGHGDGLALLRGTLAHEAIRIWFTSGVRPDAIQVARQVEPSAAEATILRAAIDVEQMLANFDGSDLARTLRRPDTRAHFELPFGWYWDGAPVHGTIDLAYEHAGSWHLVDFKTDDVRRGRIKQAAAPYLGQIALYAAALQQAVGEMPAAALHFLRPGVSYEPDPGELWKALAATRARIDAGELLAEPEP